MHCFCVHLDLTHRGRKKQYESLCVDVEEKCKEQSDKIVIAGDFNDWNRKSEKILSQRLGAREAYLQVHGHYARTFPAKLPVLPLDRIYIKNIGNVFCGELRATSVDGEKFWIVNSGEEVSGGLYLRKTECLN